jgi:hypothetical protein
MAKLMMTIQCSGAVPTLEEVRRQFALAEDEIDAAFGVVEIDPSAHLYTILVEESATSKIQPTGGWDVAGPYSNPRIAPFGPPRS